MGAVCAHNCTDLPIGYQCSCHRGYKLDEDKHSCTDMNECEEELICSQLCRNLQGSYECSCAAGYALTTDGKSCKLVDGSVEDYRLLLSSRHAVISYDLTGRVQKVLLSNLSNAVALDFHWESRTLFWSEVTPADSLIGRIHISGLNGTFKQMKSLDVKNPDGIAVDWAGENLYWCDKTEDSIRVAKLDGRFPKTLLQGKPLQEPRAIVLDPAARYLFYSDWGEAAHIGL